MSESQSKEVTQLLCSVVEGEERCAENLMPVVYDQLRALAGKMLESERPGATLQPTALVNEAYLRLIDQTRVDWKGRSHFFAIGATIMRRILVDYARAKNRYKRGGGWKRVELEGAAELSIGRDDDVLAVDEALEKLKSIDPVQAKIVEMRFFGGMTVAEVAEVLQVSKRKIEYEWQMIRAWLRRELEQEDQG
jgi:RNA polymerase sigma factor (TIGR02999 family)